MQEVEALKELEERTVMEAFGQLCWEQWQNEIFGVGKCRKAARRADTSRRIYRDFFVNFLVGIFERI